jgi:hypothetical protein
VGITFERIREIKPRRLFIAADGPRSHRPDDTNKCLAARELVLSMIDWDCEVKTLMRDRNLGSGRAVSEGISWFFDHVEQGIILEDDVLADKSFFAFCQSLLARFKSDESVMHISGNNFQQGIWRGEGSYYFSKYSHNWGWATWSDAWKKFSFDISDDKLQPYIDRFRLKEERAYWQAIRQKIHLGEFDAWDYQWMFAIWKNQGKCILPNVNLVMNLGFGPDATHTTTLPDSLANQRINSLTDIRHPLVSINTEADEYTFSTHFKREKMLNQKFKTLLFPYFGWSKKILRRFRFRLWHNQFKEYTMIPSDIYISNLELCYRFRTIEGDIVECGTWKGGMIASIAKLIGKNTKYYLFDSFAGLPEAKEIDGKSALSWQSGNEPSFYFDNCSCKKEDALHALAKAEVTNFEICEGWFQDTLPNFVTSNGISILRLDGDWYDSTITCLRDLYPKVNIGGVVIIDDYIAWDGCSRAVHDYLSEIKSASKVQSYNSVYYLIKKG